MSNEHPITPPPELVKQWRSQWMAADGGTDSYQNIATQAARWGWDKRGAANEKELQEVRDQELEACIEYFHKYDASWGEHSDLVTGLRATRRPKPLSQADLALEALDAEDDAWPIRSLEKGQRFDTIRAALKRLKELEQANSQPS